MSIMSIMSIVSTTFANEMGKATLSYKAFERREQYSTPFQGTLHHSNSSSMLREGTYLLPPGYTMPHQPRYGVSSNLAEAILN